MNEIIIERPGLLTSVQDAGRYGYRSSGISPSGAMDIPALKRANILVGNDPEEAALEITVVGPQLQFACDVVIALTGADLSPTLDYVPMAMGRAWCVREGQTLRFGARKNGCRAYLAIAGGLDIPKLMGSRATSLRYNLGGLGGRALRAGDRISLRDPVDWLPGMQERRLLQPVESPGDVIIHVLPGPQEDEFTRSGQESFYGLAGYVVDGLSDRQGYRLQGERIQHCGNGNIISDGIVMGSVQVPSNGQPIILMAEHQTTGGYTKIATVATVDLAKVAQCIPGDRIRFRKISLQEAQRLFACEENSIRKLQEKIKNLGDDPQNYHRELVTGRFYEYEIEEVRV